MDGASKKKTPITDLMAYHLNQLSQELSAKGALPSPVAEDVERVLHAAEAYNDIVWPQDSSELLAQSVASPEWNEVCAVIHERVNETLHGIHSMLIDHVKFVYADEGKSFEESLTD